MAMDAREIETMIKAKLPDAQITIEDLRGDGDHYAATVVIQDDYRVLLTLTDSAGGLVGLQG